MGLLEKIQQENVERGIVPNASAQHSKRLICEDCGAVIDWLREGSVGRYDDIGQVFYRHTECPPDEWD
jgi:Fe2+ or Zn2+ uptake regulation protein